METTAEKNIILQVDRLKQYFPVKKDSIFKPKAYVKAVDDISFELFEGETLSIVGESGCGKSTTGRAILRLDEPTDGKVLYMGKNILTLNKKDMRKLRGDLQVIFQDPFASLNPRQMVKQILNEAMAIQNVVEKSRRKERMLELLGYVGLPPEALDRYPHEFSGGQRQRIGIARALAVNPKLIICDEAVSALDVSIQAQILNLLKKLQKQFKLTFLFISHDLSVVRHISDRVMVMYLGKVVEIAEKKEMFDSPLHPYTKALLSSIPVPDPTLKRDRVILKGDVPSPIDPPGGCRFHTRCPFAVEKCKQEEPPLRELVNNHFVSCHIAETLPV
ncbi:MULTISPECIES: ABC transporter ATP-binding protein [Cytobacillus]|uniref:Peptide ABC transporter ATP-binding protein n=2 Tax=Cytobacillus TaxID=2675230 RepID=A0ABX3CZ44_9BACI|nr:dipeptide ABC transporter ATP-binding protein [Cytobacillus oceanisediminis]EFV74870.1 oligopeptide ABC transporter [Bacillus sp. 2_A_57_CT2]MCS0824343.1 dipeptide ABC transporter ATP-binding protein [Cytobacillus firmus]MBU8729930.1 dipeptide ABC transporter ATP-binding protein [Cytobacillus oceanisediminis]MCM3241750.1 dipeptide ABC transporter ATP-binding protein [Cytobacillus oceanisediminis]MCM3404000.1 dipeptide ABC transporter ATP-binding protein [Cytobacillus oceanisediminis]